MVMKFEHSTSFTEKCSRLTVIHACHLVTFLKSRSTNVVKRFFVDNVDFRPSVKIVLDLYAVNLDSHLY